MNAEAWYLDSSAVVKLAVAEPESEPLRAWLRGRSPLVSCDLLRVEAPRAVRLANPAAVARVLRAISALTLVRLDDAVLDRAATLDPPELRSLDAIHLAAALAFGTDLAGIVCYDRRLARAASRLGLEVRSPVAG